MLAKLLLRDKRARSEHHADAFSNEGRTEVAQLQESPRNPIAAATHRDPYPYYAELVERHPLYRDDALGLWVASSAAAVTAVLTSDLCRVRPASEPVPAAIAGSPAGEIFRRLVRMNDGAAHCPFNRAVAATLSSVAPAALVEQSQRCARELDAALRPARELSGLADFNFKLSAHVIGSLLGLPRNRLDQAAAWTGAFVRCVFPGSTPTQIAQGKAAAENLLALFRDVYQNGRGGLLGVLGREGEHVGRAAEDVILANGIGLLSQAYEATAGLIGNTLLALAARPRLRAQFAADTAFARAVILEVLRHDPPTHNTRRFAVQDGAIAGQEVNAGEGILVVVAAANRDPAANPEPHRFDPSRRNPRVYTFGVGVHACPGEVFAVAIAQTGVRHLLEAGLDLDRLLERFTYRPSANTRIPLFGHDDPPET